MILSPKFAQITSSKQIKFTFAKRGEVSPSLGFMLAEGKTRAEQLIVANRTHEVN